MTSQLTPESNELRPSAGKTAIQAVLLMLIGATVAAGGLYLAGWLVVPSEMQVAASSDQLWTCGMHPEVIQEQSGICPICHMDLTPMTDAPDHQAHDQETELWTCPMHPEVLQDEPGSCPICKMDLVPKEVEAHKSAAGEDGFGTTVTIDPTVVQNMNVRVEHVERRDLVRQIRTVGHLEYDQERMVSVTTRFEGFVEKVHVNYVGEPVEQGQALFEVYSPELVQTQRELLSAVDYVRRMASADDDSRRRAESLVAAARQRLSYWGISQDQIDRIEKSGEVTRALEVTAPMTGVVMRRVRGLEGMAIRPGVEAMHVVDLSSLWLTVEVYEDQLPWLDVGSQAEVSFDYLPGEAFNGRVRFIEPEVSADTRTITLTLEVPNPSGQLRVGMYATVVFEPVVAKNAVVVPTQSVIRSGARDVVVVERGQGRFAPRDVRLGVESNGYIQILEGLDGNEVVVTSAQFLIDSESNLRAAVDKLIAERRGHQH